MIPAQVTRRSLSLSMVVVVLACFDALESRADDAAGHDDQQQGDTVHFESVRQIFAQHCVECHSEEAARNQDLQGELLLDSKDGWQRGGASGPAIIPGDADSSRLIVALKYADEALRMPPEGKLSQSAIETVAKWVDAGAFDPRRSTTRLDELSGKPHSDTAAVASTQASAGNDHRSMLKKYCVTCHNGRMKSGGLGLDDRRADVSQVMSEPELWEKVVHKLHSRTMPPPGRPRPDDAQYNALVGWLESSLDRAAASSPNPGRPLLHRMNRTEYRNAVRDLLGVEIDISGLPADDATYGFDNIADALGTSPLLLESYVTTARKVARLAIGSPMLPATTTTFKTAEDLTQDYHLDGLPLGTRGGIRVTNYFPVDAEYELRVRLRRGAIGAIRGLQVEHQLELSVDGKRVGLFKIGGPDAYKPVVVNKQNPGQTATRAFTADEQMKTRLPISAGRHTVVATFVGRPGALSEQTNKPYLRSYVAVNDRVGLPEVDRLEVSGPFNPTRPEESQSRRRIFARGVADNGEGVEAALAVLSRLGRLAFRRPLDRAELDQLVDFYQQGQSEGDFESGIELALQFLLASPQFIFRTESEPIDVPAGDVYQLTDLDLASRLSFFLWSSLPDENLLTAAEQGRLGTPKEIETQVLRMLADPKSTALVENFAGQWLFLRNLANTHPDPRTFPDFDDNLRRSLHRETAMFFESILAEDRSLLDLLTADYTFVNERLARHYGMSGVYGDRFRRVRVTDDARRGLLGHGSILTVTSYATRTSPVLRGRWILENLLGAPPPPPPPDVPDLEDTGSAEGLSVRARLEQHRANTACAVCHARMDPYGFGLENFDAIGRWRAIGTDGVEIDASDTLPDGTAFSGPSELRNAIMQRPDLFVDTFTRKLMTYAIGRGLEYHDGPAIRRIVRQAADDNYRITSIIKGIVMSDPFRKKMKRSMPESAQVTALPH